MGHDAGVEGQPGLSDTQLDALRPYVVELRDGKFPTTAELNTTAADVDAIFSTHLPAFIEARGAGPVPVVFWAHGGLVSEDAALAEARRNIPWWLSNGIYPIHFLWHSGLWDTLGDLVASHVTEMLAAPGARGGVELGWTDFTDGLIEGVLRGVGGPEIWGALKDNARHASEPGGGAAYVAGGVQAFMAANPGAAALHAAAFSAGANLHQHFIPAVVGGAIVGGQARQGPSFETCSLLVPALRTDAFKAGLVPLIGTGIRRLAMLGMKEELALADNCFGVYRKSALYLVRGALEAEPGTPYLGLQQCVREDPDLARLFDPATGTADAVWSVAATGPLDSRSAATHHMAFNDDVPTMDSVARRIAGRDHIVSFGTTQHAGVMRAVAGLAR